jgi:hypothetical protein
VSWEIAPGLLVDGSVVDVWSKSLDVSWSMPGSGAPSTSSARPGRWRSFPYLAELEGDDGEALWRYSCAEWDRDNRVNLYPDRHLVRYNFFIRHGRRQCRVNLPQWVRGRRRLVSRRYWGPKFGVEKPHSPHPYHHPAKALVLEIARIESRVDSAPSR